MWWNRLFLIALVAGPAARAAEVEIDPAASVFAVLTQKGGVVSGLAHDHLVTAAGYRARLDFDPQDPAAARFELEAAAEELEVDRPDLQQAWAPRLEALGVLRAPLREISEKDRRKIRRTMLSARQLDGRRYPRIAARVTGAEERASTAGEVTFPWAVRLALEVHGQTVEREVAARFELTGDRLVIEALGAFRFTELGIEPYSAFLGAVNNLDELYVYLNLAGTVAASGE